MGVKMNNFTSVGFVFLLLLPVGALIFWGVPEPYERRPYTDFPSYSEALSDSIEGRQQFADAVFERSVLRRASIRLKNQIEKYVFGYSRSPQVASGEGEVLFFVPALETYQCDDQRFQNGQLYGIELIGALADAGDVPVVFAMPPNKESYWIDAASSGPAHTRGRCYHLRRSQVVRQVDSSLRGRFLDHLPGLQQLNLPPEEVYRRSDTHWQPAAAAAAVPDLISRVAGDMPQIIQTPRLRSFEVSHGDLASMLLLETPDVRVLLAQEEVQSLQSLARSVGEQDIVIVHDSFYQEFDDELNAAFSRANLIHFGEFRLEMDLIPEGAISGDQDFYYNSIIQSADQLIVSVVERNFLPMLVGNSNRGLVSLNSPIGNFLISRNQVAAADLCGEDNFDQSIVERLDVVNATQLDGRRYRSEGDAQVMATLGGAPSSSHVCVQIMVDFLNEGQHQLFLPGGNDRPSEVASFRRGHQIGLLEYRLILPSTYLTRSLRFDPTVRSGDEFEIVSLKVWALDQGPT